MTDEDLQIKRQELCGEFWLDLRRELEKIGGDPAIVDLVAPNGIRPVFKKEGHIHRHRSPPDEE